MYRKTLSTKTSIQINTSTEGESLEQKIERVVNNGEPITDGAPIIYTERKDGVLAGYDIRTDRFEVALDAMNKVAGAKIAKRDGNVIEMKKDQETPKNEGGNEGENKS